MSSNKRHLLLIGCCGSGKTWVMKEIIKRNNFHKKAKFNLIRFLIDSNICLLGKYVGETFDGSDKLSMAVSKDFKEFYKLVDSKGWKVVCEGDRFTNKNFIETFNPLIIKITDDGKKGRDGRGSKQSKEHLKRIETRISNINADIEASNSSDALSLILKLIDEKS